ncbi:MAG: flagellar export chaperone FlgN [Bacteroidetes bacterium]|nr:flagellar export chaperone FlgN [Bacteroidota bacterium]MCL5027284.1 flagellar export chaperone FlgN [Chloroflexota bacterium]
MDYRNPVEPLRGDPVTLVARLEHTLQQEEAALARLEYLVGNEHWILMNGEPRGILDRAQEVEEAVARLGQLEAVRASLAARVAGGADGPPSTSLLTAASGADASAPARLLQLRHRIMGATARIATSNEANALLLAGLSRVAGATAGKLSQLREAEASAWPFPSRASTDTGAGCRPSAFDLRA